MLSSKRTILGNIYAVSRVYYLPKTLDVYKRNMSIRLFEEEGHAEAYAKYRPTYPDVVYEEIASHCRRSAKSKGKLELAVDIGCGNGQSTLPLADHFTKVIGMDVSEKQVQQARAKVSCGKVPDVTFRVGPGENLDFLANNSVDLVTVAQAIHWMDVGLFYKEATRVLKTGGSLVLYGYGNTLLDNEEANDLVMHVGIKSVMIYIFILFNK